MHGHHAMYIHHNGYHCDIEIFIVLSEKICRMHDRSRLVNNKCFACMENG